MTVDPYGISNDDVDEYDARVVRSKVACPLCGAEIGELCDRSAGPIEFINHEARNEAAGHPRLGWR